MDILIFIKLSKDDKDAHPPKYHYIHNLNESYAEKKTLSVKKGLAQKCVFCCRTMTNHYQSITVNCALSTYI